MSAAATGAAPSVAASAIGEADAAATLSEDPPADDPALAAAEDLRDAGAAPLIEEDEDDDVVPQGAVHASPSHGSGHGQRNGMGMMNGRPPQISRASNKDETFAEGDHVVYPTHGVGRVEKIATEEIAGHRLELIHITFEENRMTLRVPVAKARSAGLRKLATRKLFDEALAVLKGRARIKRTMWSRRAQEYEAKINSGDPLAIAEVVRDLHRNSGQPDQSFSERQIYEAAMDRLAAELAALDQTDKTTASTKLTNYLKTIA
jgi:CarD family transcriptional regulator